MRNLTKTLAVISLLAPVSAQPLGIGVLKLHSALNQRLDAEINLLLSAGENPNELQVRLAPPEKFDEAGIPWNYFLPKIKFEKVVQADGSVIVKLRSNEALQEPFLDFLVEVSWAEGNLYREFTVLVGPPAVYEQPVVVAVEEKSETVETLDAETVEVEPQAKPLVEPVQAEPAGVTEQVSTDSYGPTTRSDTLWSIADQLKPSGDVSTEQMVMAIFEANPKAFYKNNVNALMSGSVLDVPDNEAVVKLSKQQAAKLFRQQRQQWNELDKKVAVAEPEKVTEQPPSTQLKLEAPVEAEVVEQVVVTPDQEQPSDTTENIEVEAATETLDVVSSKDEPLAVKQSDLDAMQVRLQEMEQRLKEMQELLAMKDAELAALQNKRQEELQAKVEKPVQALSAGEQTKAEPVKTEQVKPAPVEPVKPKVTPVKPKLKTVPVDAEEPEAGLFGDSYYSVVGGLGVLVLGGLGWLWWRKRKVEEETEAESMFASSSEIRLPDSEVAAMPVDDISSYDVGTVGESSFLSEFTPSDFDAFDSEQNEVDPISEADVYLAYGRYQQAEELMRQAIADEPEREDCKLKLLEIFYANENKQAFEDYARELAEAGMRDNHSFWMKVMEMGNEIIPDSSVLTSAEPETETANFAVDQDDAETDVKEELQDEFADQEQESFDLESFDKSSESVEEVAESTQPDEENEESDNLDLDFDLSMFEEPEAKDVSADTNAEESPLGDDLESIEFDLSSFAEPEPEQEKADDLETISSGEDETESFDFDLGEEVKEESSEPAELEADLGLEIDEKSDEALDSFDFSEISAPPAEDSVEEPAKDKDLGLDSGEDDFDFNFDFDEVDDSQGSLEGVADLTDMDEFETKIDLARAYIDMGDNEAALSIAKEVLEKGNDQQKQAAQAILDQLA